MGLKRLSVPRSSPVHLHGLHDRTSRVDGATVRRPAQHAGPGARSLYLAVILTATIFAIATGIVGAVVTVLSMAEPTMIKAGYDARLSSGAIAAGGTLGILIPRPPPCS